MSIESLSKAERHHRQKKYIPVKKQQIFSESEATTVSPIKGKCRTKTLIVENQQDIIIGINH